MKIGQKGLSTTAIVGIVVTVVVVIVAVAAVVVLKEGSGLTHHDPIFINSNGDFTSANGITSGSGTQADPYIIENWVINASSANGIQIQNTIKYFVIRNCLIENGSPGDYSGIFLASVSNGKIENNICKHNFKGIALDFISYEAWLETQTVTKNSNNNLVNNTCENNSIGIYLVASHYNNLTNNTCENNSIGIYLGTSDNNTTENNTVKNNSFTGIYLASSSDDNLTNNIVKNNSTTGIRLDDSSWNILLNNTCENNECGINLSSSEYNILKNNTCEGNSYYGIFLYSLSNNNAIFRNYLLNNMRNNAYDNGANWWDYNGKGNYWSDWQPPEHPDAYGDGIVDEPRPIIGGTNQDNYPLVQVS